MKSKTETKPWTPAQPYILDAASNLKSTYAANAGNTQQLADDVTGLMPGLLQKYNDGNPALKAATGYATDVLSGKYLSSNPYLDGVINNSNNDVRNQVQASVGSRGGTGGSAYYGILSRELAKNDTNARFTDYNNQMGRMDSAAQLAPSLAAADYAGVTPILATAEAGAQIPYQAAQAYASGVGGLLSPYQTTTQKSSPLSLLAQLGGGALGAWAGGGFK